MATEGSATTKTADLPEGTDNVATPPVQQSSPPEHDVPLEADEALHELDPNAHDTDADSTFGDIPGSATTSLSSSILNHTYENGRRYHAYRQGEYPLPNDEQEQERLDLLHHIWKLILKGELYSAPIPPNPQRVLDFGTGTGIWAIDFADEYPSAMVIGTDLSPIQPSWVPPSCVFYVDDSDSAWTFQPHEAFDFIHGRAMGGSIKDWPVLYSEIYKHLKPGGWVEIQEYETWCQPNEPEAGYPKYMLEWQTGVNLASEKFGKKLNVARDHKDNMLAAGFVGVEDILHKVPIGPWPKDPKAKEIGRYELAHMLDAVEPFALALFTRALGWSRAEIEVLGAGVRADFMNPRNHLFSYFHCVYGQKPLDTEARD